MSAVEREAGADCAVIKPRGLLGLVVDDMKPTRIDSIDDPRIAVYRDLPGRSAESGWMIAEGRWLVERLLASDHDVTSILCDESLAAEIQTLEPPAALFTASGELLNDILGIRFHRGVLACAERREGLSLAALATTVSARAALAICDGVSDPENLGSLIRTAVALNAEGLVLGPGCADPLSRRALRVSMGASLQMPIVECRDLAAAVDELKQHEFRVLGAVLQRVDSVSLERVIDSPRLAIAFGNEGYGLTPEVLKRCDQLVALPMSDAVDSLNVAVAAGIFLHYFRR